MQDFAAIDFETVNERRSCVCSIGVMNDVPVYAASV